MKKIGAVLILSLLSFNLAYGADNKMEDFAASPLIKNLALKADGGKIKAYYRTASGDDKEFDSVTDKSFRYAFDKGETKAIYYKVFNPLEVAVKLDVTEEKTGMNDPGPFFQVLSTYSPVFIGKSATEPLKPTSEDKSNIFQAEQKTVPVNANDPECDTLITNYNELANAYNNVNKPKDNDKPLSEDEIKKAINELAVTDKLLGNWKGKTTSSTGIDDVTTSIAELTGKLDANVTRIKAAIKVIVNTGEKGTCYSLPVIVIAETSYIMSKSTEAISHRETASTNLKSLSEYLKKYKSDWEGTNYKIGSISQPAKDNLKKVTIRVKQIEFSTTDDKVTIKESDKNGISNTFSVYQNENVVFEGAVGFVFSPLKSNKFSTKTVNGNQVVEKTESNDNYHAAALLNIYKTNWLIESVYPYFQLGLSTAKDYPAILTGIGVKIRGTSFALSGGAAFGFSKELDKLSEGSTVTGQADIDKDEKTVVKPNWYLSLQYSF